MQVGETPGNHYFLFSGEVIVILNEGEVITIIINGVCYVCRVEGK